LTRALDDLKAVQGSKHVDLYVLDMYFPREGKNTPEELTKLGKAWDEFRRAERALRGVLSGLGQSLEGGLKLAKEVESRGWHSRTPFVFFTRKGNLLDAITAYEQSGALAVVKKPDPRDEFDESNRGEAYDKAMVDNKNSLVMAFDATIHKGSFWYRHKDHIAGFVTGVFSSTFVAIAGWLFAKWAS
jgi:hypothetical protein